MSPTRDVLLSHAGPDKALYVKPFADELALRGVTYWLDEAELQWGDKITQHINAGMRASRFVIVFLSDSFLGKNWPEAELGASLSKENASGQTVVLPLMIADAQIVLNRYPLLRDKVYVEWSAGIPALVDTLERLLGRGSAQPSLPVDTTKFTAPTKDDLRWLDDPIIADLSHDPTFFHALRDPRFAEYPQQHARPDPRLPLSKFISEMPPALRDEVQESIGRFRDLGAGIRKAIGSEQPSDGSLEIVSLSQTHEAELDVVVRNLSNQTCCITRVVLRVLRDHAIVLPVLRPSATYAIPLSNVAVGRAGDLRVSHIVEPHSADRFLIATRCTRQLYLRLTLEYNQRYSVGAFVWLWA